MIKRHYPTGEEGRTDFKSNPKLPLIVKSTGNCPDPSP